MELRQDKIQVIGGYIPITLTENKRFYSVKIDGVEWINTESQHHAIIIYELLKDHITEYMHYEKV